MWKEAKAVWMVGHPAELDVIMLGLVTLEGPQRCCMVASCCSNFNKCKGRISDEVCLAGIYDRWRTGICRCRRDALSSNHFVVCNIDMSQMRTHISVDQKCSYY